MIKKTMLAETSAGLNYIRLYRVEHIRDDGSIGLTLVRVSYGDDIRLPAVNTEQKGWLLYWLITGKDDPTVTEKIGKDILDRLVTR